jgi:hypothetical protein
MIARKVCLFSQYNFGPTNARTESWMSYTPGQYLKGPHRG